MGWGSCWGARGWCRFGAVLGALEPPGCTGVEGLGGLLKWIWSKNGTVAVYLPLYAVEELSLGSFDLEFAVSEVLQMSVVVSNACAGHEMKPGAASSLVGRLDVPVVVGDIRKRVLKAGERRPGVEPVTAM